MFLNKYRNYKKVCEIEDRIDELKSEIGRKRLELWHLIREKRVLNGEALSPRHMTFTQDDLEQIEARAIRSGPGRSTTS